MFGKLLILTILVAVAVAWVARPSESAGPPRHYTVRAGDTLWSIAASHYRGDPRAAVWRLERRNPRLAAALQPGDVLTLP